MMRAKHEVYMKKICRICGLPFITTQYAKLVCDRVHTRPCPVCGKPVPFKRPSDAIKCCSKECTKELRKSTMMERHGVEYAQQSPAIRAKSEATNMKNWGYRYATMSPIMKERVRQHFQETIGYDTPLVAPWFAEKRKQTCLRKHGTEFTGNSPEHIKSMRNTCMKIYGGPAPMCNPEVRKIAYQKNGGVSSLEQRVQSWLKQFDLSPKFGYTIQLGDMSHEFDIYLPELNLLIDCDGLLFHGYILDSDGKWCDDERDARRLSLVPEDCKFEIVVEQHEDSAFRRIQHIILDQPSLQAYQQEIFNWCRSQEFPYPNYTSDRLIKQYGRLCELDVSKNPKRNFTGESIIRQYHKSIWKAHVYGKPSPLDAWYSDDLLMKVITNRCMYVDTVDPSKVLYGFTVAKIAPRVSMFNPALARYLAQRYLSDFYEVFDPFSGYSGRLLGVCSSSKHYIGQDINSAAVSESNEIISKFHLDASVRHYDSLTDSGQYECLLTCPPYGNKEIYTDDLVVKTCDEWIDICLSNFNCKRYVFVVDSTVKYSDNIVEELSDTSYLRKSSEYVILINRI